MTEAPATARGEPPADAWALAGRLLRTVAPEVDPGSLDPDALLHEAVDLDSVDFLALMAAVAEATGAEVAGRDYRLVTSLRGLAAYLARARGAGPRGPAAQSAG